MVCRVASQMYLAKKYYLFREGWRKGVSRTAPTGIREGGRNFFRYFRDPIQMAESEGRMKKNLKNMAIEMSR
jgi:hypothetical protein